MNLNCEMSLSAILGWMWVLKLFMVICLVDVQSMYPDTQTCVYSEWMNAVCMRLPQGDNVCDMSVGEYDCRYRCHMPHIFQ